MIPYLDVQLMLSGRDVISMGGKLQLTIDGKVELPFTVDGDGFCFCQCECLAELHRYIVGVLFPEWWEHGTTLCAAVVEDVAEPYLEIARIPYPGGFIVFLHDV